MSGSQIKQPKVTIAIANANVSVGNAPHQVLFVGQKVAAGSAAASALVTNIGNEGEEDALFGANSQIAGAVRAFRAVNKVTRVDAIPLDDNGSGVPRVVDFIFAGTSSAAGTITLNVASEENHSFEVAIPNSTAAASIPALLVTAANADLDLPFTLADATSGETSVTADNDGTVANDAGVEVIVNVEGITLSQDVTEHTAGSVDPTLTSVLDVATERYQGINWPYRATAALETYLGARFNPTNAILDGVGFIPLVDTLANVTDGSTGVVDVLNDQSLVFFADQLETEASGTASKESYIGPAQNEMGYAKTAYFMAVRALRFTDGENVASFVTSSSSLDQIGGVASASLPYFNTPLSLLPLVKSGRGWTDTEIETIFTAGGSVIGVNIGGTGALVGEVVTTYKTDAASNPDPTFQFLNYVDTESNIREYRFNNLKARFAQSRLTEGAVARNRDMANAALIRAYVEQLYKDTSGDDFVLTQAGDAAAAFYKANLNVSLDLSTGSVTVTDLTPIVTQLREIIMTMKVSFTVN
jgi:phage tail sheath gpL-like